jgi:hypothetical protein
MKNSAGLSFLPSTEVVQKEKKGISCGRSWSHALDVSSGWEISIENAQSGDGKSTIFRVEPTNEKQVKQFLGATQEETTEKKK